MWIIQAAVTGDTNAIVVMQKDTTPNKAWAFAGGLAGWIAGKIIKTIRVNRLSEDNFPAMFSMPLFKVTPEEIFSDEVPAFHANFINPREYSDNDRNSAVILAPTIGKWYVAIRNIVLVALMVVLLYVGIRILISTAAEEKAKYLASLKNWLIALILVIFMHYIMAFAQTMTNYVVDLLRSQSTTATVVLPAKFEEQFVEKADLSEETVADLQRDTDGSGDENGIVWPVNLMELAKIRSQMIGQDEEGNQLTGLSKLGYTFIYLIFVIFTLTFVITYLKRLVYLAFLTLIAPMVALTYPIDKIKDGQAQAFDMWVKEYMFNLLLQPLHYVLYIVLIGTAMDIATTNMLYAIAAMGFLMEAEQLMRKFFGFEKAGTTGKIMGGVLGGAMAINAIQNLGKLGSGVKGSKGGSSGSGSGGGDGRVKTVDPAERSADSGSPDMDSLIGDLRDGNNGDNGAGAGLLDDGNGRDGQNQPQLTEDQERVLADMRSYRDAGLMSDEELERQMNSYLGTGNQPAGQDSESADTLRLQQDAAQAEAENSLRTSDNDSNQKRPRRKVIRGIGRVAKAYAPGMARKALRFTAKGAGAALLGMYGLAAGVASGDSSKVLQYGAIGAGAGMAVGNAGANLVGNAVQGGKNVRDTFRQGAYTPDELKRIRNQESDKAWKKNKDIDRLYKEQYEKYCQKRNIEVTKDGYKDYKKAALAIRQQSGITDDKMISKVLNTGGIDNHKENLLLARASTQVKGDKELETFRKRLQENGISQEKIADLSKNIRSINDF